MPSSAQQSKSSLFPHPFIVEPVKSLAHCNVSILEPTGIVQLHVIYTMCQDATAMGKEETVQ